MNRLIGLALAVAIGLALPVCAKERANVEIVVVHITQEGREYSRVKRLYRTPIECEMARIRVMIEYWKAVASGYRSGMKATCFERI